VELSCVLIGFSRRGGEERKGDGLHFGLRVGVWAESGHRCAYCLQCTTAATWTASFHESTATLSLSDSESDTAHTRTRISRLSPAAAATRLSSSRSSSRLVSPPCSRSPLALAARIMRLACRFVHWRASDETVLATKALLNDLCLETVS
jgi:hypothetical protein